MKFWHGLLIALASAILFYVVGGQALQGDYREPETPEVDHREEVIAEEWRYLNQEPPLYIRNRLKEEGFPMEQVPLPGVMSLTAVHQLEDGLEVIFSLTPSSPADEWWEGEEKNWHGMVRGWYLTALKNRDWEYRFFFASAEGNIIATREHWEVEINVLESRPLYTEVFLRVREEQ